MTDMKLNFLRVIRFIFFLLINLPFCFGAQEINEGNSDLNIEWSRERPLNKTDFKADFTDERPTDSDGIEALSSIYIKIDFEGSAAGKFRCSFKAYFRPNDSWSTPNMQDSLLLHEQIHFNICELIARKLRARYKEEVNASDISNVYEDYNKMMKELMGMSNLYDIETFGIYYPAQVKWKKKIDEELEQLRDYELKNGIELYRLKRVRPINRKPK
jgi:hypothetical protein